MTEFFRPTKRKIIISSILFIVLYGVVIYYIATRIVVCQAVDACPTWEEAVFTSSLILLPFALIISYLLGCLTEAIIDKKN